MNPKQKITTFLTFDGTAEQAMNLYVSVFRNARVVSTSRYGKGAPAPEGTFMTGTFEIEGQTFAVLNGGPSFTFAEGISLFVSCDTQEEIDHLWSKLSEGGSGGQCGWLKDRFGVSWQIVPRKLGELLGDPDRERGGRVMKAMLGMKKLVIADLERARDGA